MMPQIIIIAGATATGKTKLAVSLAKKLNTEVISADSQLVYRGLNIGTAKPTREEMDGVAHHMIDVVDPESEFSVSDYRAQALPILERLIAQGKTPIICGGTGFYINSLLYDLSYGNSAASDEIRDKYEQMAEQEGKEAVFECLKQVDPKTAEKLHPNDVKRVIRALEIYDSTGKRKSEQNDLETPKFSYVAFAIEYPREELYRRIDVRVDQMFNQGLQEEVQSLLKSGIPQNAQCLSAIGYKEVVECLNNGDNQSTMRDIIKLNTRHYAKRQGTFFKKMPNLIYLKPEQATAEFVIETLQKMER